MTLEDLDRILTLAAKTVDEAAASVASERFEPVKDHVFKLGGALADIFEVQRAVYALRPDLEPQFLRERSPHSPRASREYGEKLLEAFELVDRGELGAASALWCSYLAGELDPFFREMAEQHLRELAENNGGA